MIYYIHILIKEGVCKMVENRPMATLLVEDDTSECDRYKEYINTIDNVKLIGVVNSCASAVRHIHMHAPEAIILDIELNVGQGSGIDLLEEINKMTLDFKPIIAVITNIFAKEVHDYLHTQGAHLIFYKRKEDYSAELVVNNLFKIWKSASKLQASNKIGIMEEETLAEKLDRVAQKIDLELDLIGIGRNLSGRKYAHEAILYAVNVENIDNSENVFNYLGKKHNRQGTSIYKSIQVGIEHAWRSSPVENLHKYYTQGFDFRRGNPTAPEFVYYYADKVKKEL